MAGHHTGPTGAPSIRLSDNMLSGLATGRVDALNQCTERNSYNTAAFMDFNDITTRSSTMLERIKQFLSDLRKNGALFITPPGLNEVPNLTQGDVDFFSRLNNSLRSKRLFSWAYYMFVNGFNIWVATAAAAVPVAVAPPPVVAAPAAGAPAAGAPAAGAPAAGAPAAGGPGGAGAAADPIPYLVGLQTATNQLVVDLGAVSAATTPIVPQLNALGVNLGAVSAQTTQMIPQLANLDTNLNHVMTVATSIVTRGVTTYTQLSDLRTQLTALETDLGGVTNATRTIIAAGNTAEGHLTNIGGQLTRLGADVTAMQGIANTIDATVRAPNAQLTELLREVRQIGIQITTMQNTGVAGTAAGGGTDAQIAAFQARVAELTNQLVQTRGDIDNANATTDAIRAELATANANAAAARAEADRANADAAAANAAAAAAAAGAAAGAGAAVPSGPDQAQYDALQAQCTHYLNRQIIAISQLRDLQITHTTVLAALNDLESLTTNQNLELVNLREISQTRLTALDARERDYNRVFELNRVLATGARRLSLERNELSDAAIASGDENRARIARLLTENERLQVENRQLGQAGNAITDCYQSIVAILDRIDLVRSLQKYQEIIRSGSSEGEKIQSIIQLLADSNSLFDTYIKTANRDKDRLKNIISLVHKQKLKIFVRDLQLSGYNFSAERITALNDLTTSELGDNFEYMDNMIIPVQSRGIKSIIDAYWALKLTIFNSQQIINLLGMDDFITIIMGLFNPNLLQEELRSIETAGDTIEDNPMSSINTNHAVFGEDRNDNCRIIEDFFRDANIPSSPLTLLGFYVFCSTQHVNMETMTLEFEPINVSQFDGFLYYYNDAMCRGVLIQLLNIMRRLDWGPVKIANVLSSSIKKRILREGVAGGAAGGGAAGGEDAGDEVAGGEDAGGEDAGGGPADGGPADGGPADGVPADGGPAGGGADGGG